MSDSRDGLSSRGSRRLLARTGTATVGAATAALVAAVVLASPATSAEPNHQACLGHDIRAYAALGAGFGAFVTGLSDGGVGTEIQAHLAGLVPDGAITNSCNDH